MSQNEHACHPLILAVAHNSIESALRLIKEDADVNAVCTAMGLSPLGGF